MALKAGTVTTGNDADFADSMAEAIEDAFMREWQTIYPHPLPAGLQEFWRAWFAGIAQGVIRYLTDHAEDSFRVHSVEVTQDDGEITSTGTITRTQISSLLWSSGIDETDVQVTQDSGTTGSPNRVETVQGVGKVEILTEGVLHP